MQDDEIKSRWLGSVGYLSTLVQSAPRCSRPTPGMLLLPPPRACSTMRYSSWGSDFVFMYVLCYNLLMKLSEYCYWTMISIQNENYDRQCQQTLSDHCWVSIKNKVRCQHAAVWMRSAVLMQAAGCWMQSAGLHLMRERIIVYDRTSPSFSIKALKQPAAQRLPFIYIYIFYFFDIGIRSRDLKLVYSRSFEMNQQQTYQSTQIHFRCCSQS